MGIENALQSVMYSRGNSEKTFLDKLYAREEVEKIRQIIEKEDLTKQDLHQVLNLMGGVEQKLLCYSHEERYILLKFFVWIRDYVKLLEQTYDTVDRLESKKTFNMTDRTKLYVKNIKELMQQSVRFLIDVYLNIGRTSLSIDGKGFIESLKNKYELSYGEYKVTPPTNVAPPAN